MKKIIPVLVIMSFAITLVGLGYVANAQVAIGQRSDEVKVIQEILKTDPEIYPEGYVTGYYGQLTEKAVKKLQKRCGLAETGVIDEETQKCIFPIDYRVRVVSPNGGETWSRNEVQTIKWEVEVPEVILKEKKPYPFWFKGSLDLFRRKPQVPCSAGQICTTTSALAFVKHIATVNLLDKTYSWRITPDILNGKDYVVRVSLGPGVGPMWYREQTGQSLPSAEEIWPTPSPPYRIYWDESDGTFEITGDITICPPCTCPVQPNMEKVITILEKMIEELQRAIALLK